MRQISASMSGLLALAPSAKIPGCSHPAAIAESGYPGFEVTTWFGLLAPARTPGTILGGLHLETVKALALPDLRAKFANLGLEGIGNSPDEVAAVIKSGIQKWAKVIEESGIKPD